MLGRINRPLEDGPIFSASRYEKAEQHKIAQGGPIERRPGEKWFAGAIMHLHRNRQLFQSEIICGLSSHRGSCLSSVPLAGRRTSDTDGSG